MRKLLIILTAVSSIGLSACSSESRVALSKIDLPDIGLPDWSLPGVHHIRVQQGNLITQRMVNELKPGMTKRQVRFLLGTPLLIDTFHENRWDYIYTHRAAGTSFKTEIEQKRLRLEFKNDRLNKIMGDLYPQGEALAKATKEDSRERTIIVPPDAPRYDEDTGFIEKLLQKVGVKDDDAVSKKDSDPEKSESENDKTEKPATTN